MHGRRTFARELLPLARTEAVGTRRRELRDLIQRLALKRRCEGYRRIARRFRDEGLIVNVKRVLRLMRADNLSRLRRQPFVPPTTDSRHRFPVCPTSPARSNQPASTSLSVADITYVRLAEAFVYLAVVLDAFSRKVVGWALDDHDPFLLCPSEMPVPYPDMAGSGREAYARDRPVVREGDIFEVLADGLGIAEVVIVADEALIEPLFRGAPDHGEIERHRVRKEDRRKGPSSTPSPAVRFFPGREPGKLPLPDGKRDEPLPVEQKHESPADHVLGRPVRLASSPRDGRVPSKERIGSHQGSGQSISRTVFYSPVPCTPCPDIGFQFPC